MDGRTGSADARSEFVKLATRLLLEESGAARHAVPGGAPRALAGTFAAAMRTS